MNMNKTMVNGTVYESFKAACEAYGCNTGAARQWCFNHYQAATGEALEAYLVKKGLLTEIPAEPVEEEVEEISFSLDTTPGKHPTVNPIMRGLDPETGMFKDLEGNYLKDYFEVTYQYQIPGGVCDTRLVKGASRKEALLTPIGCFHVKDLTRSRYNSRYGYHPDFKIVDDIECHWAIDPEHWFPTLAKMCHFYGVTVGYFKAAVDVGASWRQASDPRPYRSIMERAAAKYDTRHGKEYRIMSVYSYCRRLHVAARTLYLRVARNWMAEGDAGDINAMLADIISKHRPRPTMDMMKARGYDPINKVYISPSGRTFKSFERMCLRYHMRAETVKRRIRHGMTLVEALGAAV